MPDPYSSYSRLRFDRPADRVVRITLEGPGLNAVDHDMHRELADVWLTVDRDPDVDVALLQGAGNAFSAGGSFGLVSLCVDDDQVHDRALQIAVGLSNGAQSAIRWTKQTLNNWYRANSATFDASLAYEFLGFAGPDAREGLASHMEKRPPNFRT